jgi:hypothetical protein
MYTMKVDRPAQPTVEKQSPVEASSYPNSTYHDGHTDSYSAELTGELASPEKTQAISNPSNTRTYRDDPSCNQFTVRRSCRLIV